MPRGKKARPAIRSEAERNRLVEENLGLVDWAVKNFFTRSPGAQRHYSHEDAHQDAATGLLRAAELYDPTRGRTFSTYANGWIWQALVRGLKRQGNLIRKPEHRCTDPTLPRCYARDPLPPGEHSLREHWDPADDEPGPPIHATRHELAELMHEALARIFPREREVLLLRATGVILDDVARRFGITRERARQIEAKALGRLRGHLHPDLED